MRDIRAIALIVVALIACACATSQKQRVVVAYQAADAGLSAFQDTEIQLYNAKSVPSLTPERHKSIQEALRRAFDIEDKAGVALQAWKSGDPIPPTVRSYFDEAERVFALLRKEFPDNDRIKILQASLPWIRALLDMIEILKLPAPELQQAAAALGVS